MGFHNVRKHRATRGYDHMDGACDPISSLHVVPFSIR